MPSRELGSALRVLHCTRQYGNKGMLPALVGY